MNEVGFDKFLSAAGHARRRIPPNAARISRIFSAQPRNLPSLRSFLEQTIRRNKDRHRSMYFPIPLLFRSSSQFFDKIKDRQITVYESNDANPSHITLPDVIFASLSPFPSSIIHPCLSVFNLDPIHPRLPFFHHFSRYIFT